MSCFTALNLSRGAGDEGALAAAGVPQAVRFAGRRRIIDRRHRCCRVAGGGVSSARGVRSYAPMMRGDGLVDGFAEVVEQVPSISDLERVGGAGARTVGVGAGRFRYSQPGSHNLRKEKWLEVTK
jgi:hypothetical protein